MTMRSTAAAADVDSRAPFVVAHRAGNDLRRLHAAAALNLPLAEADIHLHRGRLEVRHLKTAGPIPVLWDRWQLASTRAPRLLFETVLEAAAAGPELMLDLKGHDPRVSASVLRAIRAAGRRVTICSQDWRLLEPLRAVPDVRVVHSVGGARALTRLHERFADERLSGVSIHRRLLDVAAVQRLAERAELLMTWPVESVPEARRLAALGVHGLISRSFEPLAAALTEPPPGPVGP